jgi:hypothetical protein
MLFTANLKSVGLTDTLCARTHDFVLEVNTQSNKCFKNRTKVQLIF